MVIKILYEKSKELHIGSKNIEAEYRLCNKDMEEVNEDSDLGIGFDETLTVDDNILF